MFRSTLGLASAAVALTATSASAQAPPQLYNKAISVSWSMHIPATAEDGTASRIPRTISRTIYVSSKGRIFNRVTRQDARLSETKDLDPGITSSTFRYAGGRLMGVLKLPSGASQLAVSFGSGYTTCNAELVVGREDGKPIKFRGLNGKLYTQTGAPTVSGVTCSMRDGNPFAD